MYGKKNIEVENGEKRKCPTCHSIFAITNDKEILYRNITLLHINTELKQATAKCKQCKKYIEIDLSDADGSIINIE